MLKKKLLLKTHLKHKIVKKNLYKSYKYKYNFISLYSKNSCFITLSKLNNLYKYLYHIINLYSKNIKLIFINNKYIKSLTKRVKDSRMGGGKGMIEDWIIFLKKKTLIFKIIINEKNYIYIKYLFIKLKKINTKLKNYFNILYYIYK